MKQPRGCDDCTRNTIGMSHTTAEAAAATQKDERVEEEEDYDVHYALAAIRGTFKSDLVEKAFRWHNWVSLYPSQIVTTIVLGSSTAWSAIVDTHVGGWLRFCNTLQAVNALVILVAAIIGHHSVGPHLKYWRSYVCCGGAYIHWIITAFASTLLAWLFASEVAGEEGTGAALPAVLETAAAAVSITMLDGAGSLFLVAVAAQYSFALGMFLYMNVKAGQGVLSGMCSRTIWLLLACCALTLVFGSMATRMRRRLFAARGTLHLRYDELERKSREERETHAELIRLREQETVAASAAKVQAMVINFLNHQLRNPLHRLVNTREELDRLLCSSPRYSSAVGIMDEALDQLVRVCESAVAQHHTIEQARRAVLQQQNVRQLVSLVRTSVSALSGVGWVPAPNFAPNMPTFVTTDASIIRDMFVSVARWLLRHSASRGHATTSLTSSVVPAPTASLERLQNRNGIVVSPGWAEACQRAADVAAAASHETSGRRGDYSSLHNIGFTQGGGAGAAGGVFPGSDSEFSDVDGAASSSTSSMSGGAYSGSGSGGNRGAGHLEDGAGRDRRRRSSGTSGSTSSSTSSGGTRHKWEWFVRLEMQVQGTGLHGADPRALFMPLDATTHEAEQHDGPSSSSSKRAYAMELELPVARTLALLCHARIGLYDSRPTPGYTSSVFMVEIPLRQPVRELNAVDWPLPKEDEPSTASSADDPSVCSTPQADAAFHAAAYAAGSLAPPLHEAGIGRQRVGASDAFSSATSGGSNSGASLRRRRVTHSQAPPSVVVSGGGSSILSSGGSMGAELSPRLAPSDTLSDALSPRVASHSEGTGTREQSAPPPPSSLDSVTRRRANSWSARDGRLEVSLPDQPHGSGERVHVDGETPSRGREGAVFNPHLHGGSGDTSGSSSGIDATTTPLAHVPGFSDIPIAHSPPSLSRGNTASNSRGTRGSGSGGVGLAVGGGRLGHSAYRHPHTTHRHTRTGSTASTASSHKSDSALPTPLEASPPDVGFPTTANTTTNAGSTMIPSIAGQPSAVRTRAGETGTVEDRPRLASGDTLRTTSSNSAVPASPPAISPIKPWVLVVDDEELNRRINARMLSRLGLDSALAADGQDVLPALVEAERCGRPFAAILLDIVMLRENGDDTCRKLRAMGCTLPIIAATGNDTPADRVRYTDMGFSAVLGKPFMLGHLRDVLMGCGVG